MVFDCFHAHVYPFLPILNPATLQANYDCGQLPTFLLYAISVVVVPYLSMKVLSSIGFAGTMTAQIEFFTRAQLLYDFGCEQNELICLQASVLLGSFQNSLDLTKNSRFWFGNAVRIAKQMGLHRRYAMLVSVS